ncbi:ATP-grasp ribosomal peptide maturase [Streptomyces sp. NBC_01471]
MIERRAARVVRLDLADFPHHVRLTASGPDWAGMLSVRDHHVRLEDIRTVWWWHPQRARLRAGAGMLPEQAEWASNEATAGVTGVLAALPDCLHVNHPTATHAAQSKPDVLVQAPRCGLPVPPTWIGNQLEGARQFARDHGDLMCKSIASPTVLHGDSISRFFTTPLSADGLDTSITACAHQLQQKVAKKFEVRLTSVGGKLFAARIDTHSVAAQSDYRADYDALTYTSIPVPDAVRSGVSRLLAHYRLHYAAMDFLADADGRWSLVDLNPSGMFAWIEQALPELEITAELAGLLAVEEAA